MKSTEIAIRAICNSDPSIRPENLRLAITALKGEENPVSNTEPIDRGLTRRQVAVILGVSVKSVTAYAKRGLISGVTLGDKRGHVRRYSEASVRALLAARQSECDAQ